MTDQNWNIMSQNNISSKCAFVNAYTFVGLFEVSGIP